MERVPVHERSTGARLVETIETAEPFMTSTRMSWVLPATTVGKKIVMAVTGLVWLLFLAFHLWANLVVFRGPRPFNELAAFFDSRLYLLVIARAVLLVSLVMHVLAAYALARVDVAARPLPYARVRPQRATFASRTMRWTGIVVLFFIVFHILHLTTGTIQPVPFREGDVYGAVTGSFRVGWVAALYIVSLAALGTHFFHAAWAAVRSLGLVHLRAHPFDRRLATVIAFVFWIGFTAIPVAVVAGWSR
jgi:succinate dehydrogenase / fumarate reductase cytochrome b subunit